MLDLLAKVVFLVACLVAGLVIAFFVRLGLGESDAGLVAIGILGGGIFLWAIRYIIKD